MSGTPGAEPSHKPKPQERAPASKRLETSLGGDLTRFLLAALAPKAPLPPGDKPS
jgi:hypothetical protein